MRDSEGGLGEALPPAARSQRFVLARALNDAALRLHERLAEAVHGQQTLDSLDRADVELTL